jgi:hypothetical protein
MSIKALSLGYQSDQRGWDELSLFQAREDGKAEPFNSWARRSVANMVRATPIKARAMPWFLSDATATFLDNSRCFSQEKCISSRPIQVF